MLQWGRDMLDYLRSFETGGGGVLSDLAPNQLWTWVVVSVLSFGLVIVAYTTGLRISPMRKLPQLEMASGKPIPPALQNHMMWGFGAGVLFLLGGLNTQSWGVSNPGTVATMAGAFLTVLSGAARTFMGGSGRLHLLAAYGSLAAFLAGLAFSAMQAAAAFLSN